MAMLVVAVVHWPATTFDLLLYDDPVYVFENPYVMQGLTWDSVIWAFTTGHFGNWHPLTWLSLQFDVFVGGGDSCAFHTTNVLLHVASTGILALVCSRLTNSLIAGCMAAILVGIHPMHVESVAWVSERKGLLSTLFLSLSLLGYLSFVQKPGLKRGSIVILLFAMSLMAKQMGVTLPLLLPLLHMIYPSGVQRTDAHSFKSQWKNSRSIYPVLFGGLTLISAVFAITAYQTQYAANALTANENLSVANRLATVLANYVRYLVFYFWPIGFSFSFPRATDGEGIWLVAISALLIGFAIFLAYSWRHQKPYVSFAIAWYLIAFLPVIGFVQVGNQVMAMRYSDWPLLGVHLLIAHGITSIIDSTQTHQKLKPLLILISLIMVISLGVRSRSEARYWANDYALYGRAVELSPNNATAHAMLGRHFMGIGEDELAIGHLEKSIALRPDNAEALSNLALLQFNRGNHESARELSTQSLRLQPGKLEPKLVQGMLYTAEGSYAKAELVFHEVLKLYPNSYLAWFNLASVYRRQERYRDSVAHYQHSLQLNPTQWKSWYYLGDCLESIGDFQGATTAYGYAIRHSSGSSEAAIRDFLRIRLVCGDTANLEPLLGHLEDAQGLGTQMPEQVMYCVARDSKQDLKKISDWTESQSAIDHDDPFVYETLGDAFCYMEDLESANEMWSKADSRWPMESRRSAKASRQSRRIKIEAFRP